MRRGCHAAGVRSCNPVVLGFASECAATDGGVIAIGAVRENSLRVRDGQQQVAAAAWHRLQRWV